MKYKKAPKSGLLAIKSANLNKFPIESPVVGFARHKIC